MRDETETTRLLHPRDEVALDAFLRAHAASSMFLRSNLRAAGIEDRGETYQARYVGLFRRDELVAVVAHCWNGSLLLQAPVAADRLAAAAVAASGRRIRWVVGPAAQVETVLGSPLIAGRIPIKKSREELMRLDLDELKVPPALAAGSVRCRRGVESDFEKLAEWRVDYEEEAFGRTASAAIAREARAEVERVSKAGAIFVLETADERVAMCGFNARLPDTVQIGGVFTPKPLRSRGYARAVTAGALMTARKEGAASAILFTGIDNAPALRAYGNLGFERVGDYALALFET